MRHRSYIIKYRFCQLILQFFRGDPNFIHSIEKLKFQRGGGGGGGGGTQIAILLETEINAYSYGNL